MAVLDPVDQDVAERFAELVRLWTDINEAAYGGFPGWMQQPSFPHVTTAQLTAIVAEVISEGDAHSEKIARRIVRRFVGHVIRE